MSLRVAMPLGADNSSVVVTGAAGFIGRHLVSHLVGAGRRVIALGRHVGPAECSGAEAIECDLSLDPGAIAIRIAESNPALVFHLAASTGNDRAVVSSALEMMQNLLEACAALPTRPRVVVASSSAVYGEQRGARPLRETAALAPRSLYGVSKVLVEALAVHGWKVATLPVIRARLFNVVGPGQQPSRVLARLAQQIASIEAGLQAPVVHTRSLDSSRDFIDVRDAAAALRVLAERGQPGEAYNVGSGRAVRVRDALRRLLKLARLAHVELSSSPDEGVSRQCGDCRKLMALGWRRRYALERSLLDILDDWRARVSAGEVA